VFVAGQLAIGLVLIHVAWVYFYLCGTLLQTPLFAAFGWGDDEPTRSESLLRLVVTTAGGIAITGFVTFVLGLVGLIHPAAFCGWIVVMFGLFALCGDSPLRASFWRSRAGALVRAGSPGALVVYLGALLLAVPAILPEVQYDPLFGYDVVAYGWAHHHGIYVDYWRRFPYYAENWMLIATWAFAFGVDDWGNFLGWLTGCLSMLGAYAYVTHMIERARAYEAAPWLAPSAGIAAAAAVGVSPIFLRWGDTGMVDVPSGLFFFAAAAAAAAACVSPWRGWTPHAIACGAFFAGIKSSLIVFIPIFALLAYVLALRAGGRRLAVSAALAAIVLSSPWYVKNFIQGGDPIAPVLNLALHGVDSKLSKQDMEGQLADLSVGQTPDARLRAPYDILEATESTFYREPGSTVLLGLIVLPPLVVSYIVFRRRPLPWRGASTATFVLGALLFFAISYWLATSHLARYTLMFAPALAAFAVPLIVSAAAQRHAPAALALAGACLTALPASRGAYTYDYQFWQNNYEFIGGFYTDRTSYLALRVFGYTEGQYLCRVYAENPESAHRVYVVNTETLNYFFARCGATSIGDWFGPERYGDLAAAVGRGAAVEHLRRFGVDAVLVPSSAAALSLATQQDLFAQLRQGGFREVVLPNSVYHIFIARDLRAR
jgi:hypothetical protein